MSAMRDHVSGSRTRYRIAVTQELNQKKGVWKVPEPEANSTTPTHFVPRKPLYRMAAWIERVELRRVLDSVLLGLVGAASALAFNYILSFCSGLFMGKLAHYVLPDVADSIAPKSIKQCY